MEIAVAAYDHPDAARLIAEAQRDGAMRYGSEDVTPLEASEFAHPQGRFLITYDRGVPAACGGWRPYNSDAELKRLYVAPHARGQGFARALLTELERTATTAGKQRMILETGTKQPEALRLYRSHGYTEIAKFGYYAHEPDSICLGKNLGQ